MIAIFASSILVIIHLRGLIAVAPSISRVIIPVINGYQVP